MPSIRVEFPGSQGHALAGRLDTPDSAPRAWALFAHCFTCSKDSKAAIYIARALAEAGYGVLRFDFTGLGGSGGDFSNTHFSSNVDDLVAAADWLRDAHAAPALLVGHSLGGAAVLAAAHRIGELRAVATLGAPFEPAHVTHQLGEGLALIESEGQAQVTLAGRPFTLRRSFVDDVSGQPQAERIRNLRRPLLVLHAPGDTVVGVDNARRIYEAALHPKSFVSLDDADHLLFREADARFAAGVIAAWAWRYLPAGPPEADAPGPVAEGEVLVRRRGSGRLAVAIQAGRHTLVGDEPAHEGGEDLGPSAYDLLLAALGECTAITLRMYAERKQWPLQDTRVTLRHHKRPATGGDPSAPKVDHIERVIELVGDLDEAQRARLIAIANKCPMRRTLQAGPEVETREG